MRNALICLLAAFVIVLPSATAQTLRHEVADGETLYGIARSYQVSVERLIEANGIGAPELLLPGTVLTIPSQHLVLKGDTLFSIARAYNTTVDELRRLNGLSGSTIVVGQTLTVPVRSGTTVAATPSAGDQDSPAEPAPSTDRVTDAIPVAAAVEEPLSYAEGGAWPVAGTRRRLEGKFPGVMITADRGTPVSSVSGGRVVYSGPHSSFGNVVFVQSRQGYIYVYGGQETVAVQVGDQIAAGNSLGTVGVSPTEGSPALYFSVWRNDTFVDPEQAPRG
jgi:lipoprotein NlpD